MNIHMYIWEIIVYGCFPSTFNRLKYTDFISNTITIVSFNNGKKLPYNQGKNQCVVFE